MFTNGSRTPARELSPLLGFAEKSPIFQELWRGGRQCAVRREARNGISGGALSREIRSAGLLMPDNRLFFARTNFRAAFSFVSFVGCRDGMRSNIVGVPVITFAEVEDIGGVRRE
jgi:hypothetical protein